MKLFKSKIFTLFCAALIAVFLVVSTPKPKTADAALTAIITAALAAAQRAIVNQLMSSFTGVGDIINSLTLDEIIPATNDRYQKLGKQLLASEIKTAEQAASTATAASTAEFARADAQENLDIVKRAKISERQCENLTSSLLQNAGNRELKKNRELINELMRKDAKFVSGGATAAGGTVAYTLLQKERFAKFCSKDEHRGNLEDICDNTDPDRVDKDLNLSGLTECSTWPRADLDALMQLLRYTTTVSGADPLPEVDDQATKNVYLQRAMLEAQKKPHADTIAEFAANALEPETCPSVPGGDVDRLAWVNEIDRQRGITPPADRVCPGQHEFECYKYDYSHGRPQSQFLCAGDEQSAGCANDNSAELMHVIAEGNQLNQIQQLMSASEGSNTGSVAAPIGN